MSDEKQKKLDLDEFLNPQILTLDQALGLATENPDGTLTSLQSSAKTVNALCNRVTCRFTGPDDVDRLTYGERMVWDLTYMHGEVHNGGFHQYLTNGTGERSEAVKEYLRDIGAAQTLELFKRLSEIFPGGKIPCDHERRCTFVAEWAGRELENDVFDKLDDCYYKQSEDLNALIIAYAREHRGDFIEPSDEIVAKFKRKDRIKRYCCKRTDR